jgi:hypothetical protein
MSEDTSRDDQPVAATPAPPGQSGDAPETVESLRREVERLRQQLAKATAEAGEYRRAAYAMLNELDPYVPPTDEELRELVHGPRGESLLDVIKEYERRLNG